MDETNPVFENFRNKMRAFGQPIRGTTRRVSASKFLGRDDLEKRIEINARKITILKNIIQAQQVSTGEMLKSLSEDSPIKTIENDIIDIKKTISTIVETLEEQEKLEIKLFNESRRQLENQRRKEKEKNLEKFGGRMRSFIKSTADRIIQPVKNIFLQIIQFFVTLFFGRLIIKFLNFLSDPKNLNIVLGIADFIENNFGLITGGIIAGIGALALFAVKLGGISTILRIATGLNLGGGLISRGIGMRGMAMSKANIGRSVSVTGNYAGAPIGSRFLNKPTSGGFKFNKGGLVPGTGNTDSVPAMLTPGEVVISKPAVERIGAINLLNLNREAGKTNRPKIRSGRFYANEGMLTPNPSFKMPETGGTIKNPTINLDGIELPGLGGGGGGTDAITGKAKTKTFGGYTTDLLKSLTIPARFLLGIESPEDPQSKFADFYNTPEQKVDEAIRKFNLDTIKPVSNPIIPPPPPTNMDETNFDLKVIGDNASLQSDIGPLDNDIPEGELASADPKVLAILGLGVG